MTALKDKRAIITAGASGIGRVVAKKMIAAGAKVAVCDADADAVNSFAAENPDSTAVVCDVADPARVPEAIETMLKGLGGGTDILFNNAGIAGPTAAIEDISPEEWVRTVDVNLTAQYLFIRGVMAGMKAQRSGVILNMSSAAGRLGMPMRTPYAAAKWAVIGLTQSLAMEVGKFGIRVNAILPGSVRGPRMERVMAARAKLTGRPLAEIEAEEVATMSLGRMIEPEEIADLAIFVSSDAGRSISGQSLGVCGNTEILR
ncbi:SDR family oxidoreductase [Mesorhizobium huakuii]|uniref:SDR family oxidoreductase n=1 Tax=Mesorhizobium huakuii TaxID=28104 RepID=A0A7G6T4I3_9HYPH|nr:SDR family oxidoreductase [Mesorhizobium huakuii]QND61665.1 SDR family oxidoreductase [Mesorhizobium huakuii]